MTASLKALLTGAIDYAGMFPPAELSLHESLETWRHHRAGSAAWMLGRFVCPATQLAELGRAFRAEHDGSVTVVMTESDTAASFQRGVETTLTSLEHFTSPAAVASLEFRWPPLLTKEVDAPVLGNLVQFVAGESAASHGRPLTLYFEMPVESAFPQNGIQTGISVLAEYNRTIVRHQGSRAGLKIRTGGSNPASVPTTADLAATLSACHKQEVFWKATAGLHHPLRHGPSAARGHGFLNLLAAAAFADARQFDDSWTQRLLDEEEPHHFQFTEKGLAWQGETVTTAQIATARQRSLHSFGSCSIDEPYQKLCELGFL